MSDVGGRESHGNDGDVAPRENQSNGGFCVASGRLGDASVGVPTRLDNRVGERRVS
jgi:hypothetical protein